MCSVYSILYFYNKVSSRTKNIIEKIHWQYCTIFIKKGLHISGPAHFKTTKYFYMILNRPWIQEMYHVNWVLLIPHFVWKFSKICPWLRNASPMAVPSWCTYCWYNVLFQISLCLLLQLANMYPREFETPFNRFRNTGISLSVNDKDFKIYIFCIISNVFNVVEHTVIYAVKVTY